MQYRHLHKIILFFIIFVTVLGIIDRIWVAEDAYITLKHIDNYFAGNGLVFNKGERVEGYTHPLWAILIILIRYLGIPNHQGVILLGLLFTFSGILIGTLGKFKKETLPLLLFPVLLTVNSGFRDFATSGLEFSLTFFLSVILFQILLGKDLKDFFLLGVLTSSLYLTRPEFALFVAYYFFFILYGFAKRRYSLRNLITFSIPVLLIAGGWHLFRYVYYQDIFPNTYYAKSGGGSNFIQGFKYLGHTLRYSPLLIPAVIFSFIIFPLRIRSLEREGKIYFFRDLFPILLTSLYIIRVGGDFMAFRLLLPGIILYVLFSDFYINEWWENTQKKEIITTTVNAILLLFSIYFIFFGKKTPLVKGHVVDERQVYMRELNQDLYSRFTEVKYPWYLEGLKIRKLESCIEYKNFIITNSISKAKCSTGLGLGYYSVAAGTNVAVIDELGLTDKFVARQARIANYRPGHERDVGLDYLIDRGVLFCSLNHPLYDQYMSTKFGIILNLDQDFLYRLGNKLYREKVGKLKELYLRTRNAPAGKNDAELFKYLTTLEKRFGIKIMDLSPEAPKNFQKFEKCWE